MIRKAHFGSRDIVFEKSFEEIQFSTVRARNGRRIKRRLRLLSITAVVLFGFMGVGRMCWKHIEARAHISPDYAKVNIEWLLKQEEKLQVEDYKLLLQQTGMEAAGVNYLMAEGRAEQLLKLQENYFADVSVDCQSNTLITREERSKGTRAYIPWVEEGDILVSFNCHVFGWRNGHVGIVVDADKRLTLEASALGALSKIISMNHWERYPSFVVLRLKGASKEEREAIAAYAAEYLTDIPYQLQAGMVERLRQRLKEEWIPDRQTVDLQIEQKGTHCAHLVWYAYQQFGYDTDSDGGFVVTPRDLYESELWEVVQVYGM